MTDSLNRHATERRSADHASSERTAPQRAKGAYTDRHDREPSAPKCEGTYVSGGRHQSVRGSYTDVDGDRNRTGRSDGSYVTGE